MKTPTCAQLPARRRLDVDQLQRDDPYFATTLAKGVMLLRAFAPRGGWLGNKTLVERTGLTKPTVTRLARTLVQLGNLRHDPELGKYALEVGVLELANPFLSQLSMRRTARPAMQRLADKLQASVNLGMACGLQMMVVESNIGLGSRAGRPDIGAVRWMHRNAIGHAYLAAVDEQTRSALLRRMRAEIQEDWTQLEIEIEEARRHFEARGFTRLASLTPEGLKLLGLAVPITTRGPESPLVFNCVIEQDESMPQRLESEIVPSFLDMVREVRESLAL